MIIIGSGPAGLTAAIYAARANLEPIVIGGYAPGGQLMITSDVENYPGFPDGIQGPELMQNFREQAERFGTASSTSTSSASTSPAAFRLWAGDVEYTADSVIVATGASALWLGLDNETRLRGRGVSACATCDGFFFRGKKVAVVGGGDTALEEATFLTRFATEVHVLHRRDKFRGSKIMQERALDNPKIEVAGTRKSPTSWAREVNGCAARHGRPASEIDEPVEGLFLAIGYKPNTDVFRDWLRSTSKGYLVVHDETALEDRGRLHRRRRARPPLPAGGHRRRRRLQGGDRCRALAGGTGHRRGFNRHGLVALRRSLRRAQEFASYLDANPSLRANKADFWLFAGCTRCGPDLASAMRYSFDFLRGAQELRHTEAPDGARCAADAHLLAVSAASPGQHHFWG